MAKVSFEIWMEQVDRHFVMATGLGRDDWGDSMYHDKWSDGVDPYTAMAETIEEQYGQMGLESFGIEV
jgi:hypothetical protein